MEYGDIDGYGRHGILTTTPDGLLVCHECGITREFLGRHVREHGLSADEYRQRYGLGRRTPLVAPDLRQRFSDRATERVGSPAWSRFEAARDPDAAREVSREAVADVRPEVMPTKRTQAAKASRSRPRRTCDVPDCGEPQEARGWCRAHHGRWLRTGDVQADTPIRPWTRRKETP